MKILQINKYHYVKGGADVVFFNIMRLLKEKGHQVIPFCTVRKQNFSSEYDRYFTDAPEIRELPFWRKMANVFRFYWNVDAAKKIECLIKEQRPDVAHLHNIFNGISLSVLPILKKYNIPVVISMHDTRFICPSSEYKLYERCERCLTYGGLLCGLHRCYQHNFMNSWMCAFEMFHKERLFHYDKYIDKYIFLSECYKGMHAAKHNYFQQKGTVLYNFTRMKSSAVAHRGDYLLYYGRITEEKGLRTLMRVMEMLPDVRLRVVGTGVLSDELRNMRLPNVAFAGFKSGKDLVHEIENASYVILPSECEENNPLTIIESYMCGKPVVASRKSGIPEIVSEGETGFMFEPSNAENMCAVLRRALSVNNDEYMRMSGKSYIFAKQHFSEDVYYERLMKIYNEAISK